MALTRLSGANAISGTLPAANINNTSIGNVTALPAGVGGSWTKISQTDVTTPVASVEFTSGIDNTPQRYAVVIDRLVPASANQVLACQFRNASNNTYLTASYAHANYGYGNDGSGTRSNESTSDSGMSTIGCGNGMGDGTYKYAGAGVIYFSSLYDDGMNPQLHGQGVYGKQSGYAYTCHFGAFYRDTPTQVNGLKFYFGSGNISQGRFTLYSIQD